MNSCTDVSIEPPKKLFIPVIQNRFVKESHFNAFWNEHSPAGGDEHLFVVEQSYSTADASEWIGQKHALKILVTSPLDSQVGLGVTNIHVVLL